MAPWIKGKGGGKGGGKGYSPSTNMAERALLEGYRMGMQQGGHSKGGGSGAAAGSKGWGKGNEHKAPEDRTCQRQGCRAAEKKQATFGGGTKCFCCGLSLTATVPVEQLVQWAMDRRLEQEKAKKAPATAAAGAAAAPPSSEGLAALRVERLALLKAAKEGTTTAPAPTAVQEVARVFIDTALPNAKVTLEADLETALVDLDARAKSVLTSLQAECHPAESPLKHPGEIVTALLAKTSKAVEGKSQAEQALLTTRATMATMRSGGAADSDEVLALLIKREARQEKEFRALDDKAPSWELRKSTLVSIRSDYDKAATHQADGRVLGASKALSRAQARAATIDAILAAATRLKEKSAQVQQELRVTHTARAQLKDDQVAAVLQLLDDQIEKLDHEDVLFGDCDSDAEPEEPTTSTEDARDEARRLSTLLEQQLVQFQLAAANTQQIWHDLHLDFQAEPSQLPSHDAISDDLRTAATDVHALLKAVPWGYSLPSIQFIHLAVPPCHVHGLVGDTIWHACWTDRHLSITSQHAIPYKLLNILKTVAQHIAGTPSDAQITAAKERYAAAVSDADGRRRTGGPY